MESIKLWAERERCQMHSRVMKNLDFTPTPQRSATIFVSNPVLDRLAQISSGSIATQLFKRGFRQPVMVGLTPQNKTTQSFAGRAYTMRFIPAREDIDTIDTLTSVPNANNLQWVGVEQISDGEVLVIDSYRNSNSASMGNILINRALKRGARAVVSDGAFRDGRELSNLGIPVWGQGITATTRLSFHHAADLQVPIGCAGVAVYPGDVIHSDGDCVMVIPAHLASELADICSAQDQMEIYLIKQIQAGNSLWGVYPPNEQTKIDYQAWVLAQLQNKT
jgi:regulator of RNase E activity RraA